MEPQLTPHYESSDRDDTDDIENAVDSGEDKYHSDPDSGFSPRDFDDEFEGIHKVRSLQFSENKRGTHATSETGPKTANQDRDYRNEYHKLAANVQRELQCLSRMEHTLDHKIHYLKEETLRLEWHNKSLKRQSQPSSTTTNTLKDRSKTDHFFTKFTHYVRQIGLDPTQLTNEELQNLQLAFEMEVKDHLSTQQRVLVQHDPTSRKRFPAVHNQPHHHHHRLTDQRGPYVSLSHRHRMECPQRHTHARLVRYHPRHHSHQHLRARLQLVHRPRDINVDNMTYEQLLELGNRIGHVSKGFKNSQISQLNNRRFGDFVEKGDGGEDESCVICLEVFDIESMVKILGCGHLFHGLCVDKWLLDSKKCPVCGYVQQLGQVDDGEQVEGDEECKR